MYISALLLSAALPVVTLASSHHAARNHWRVAKNVHQRSTKTVNYTLDVKYDGFNFFDTWDFFSEPDPTSGLVTYQNISEARGKGLAVVNDNGTFVLSVDFTNDIQAGSPRDSVRISSKKTFSSGLFIADFAAMPYGCATWPAYWTVGPNWPNGGEVDIVEGVNLQAANQYTLHSGQGKNCTLDSSNVNGDSFTANIINTMCLSSADSDAGCAFTDTRNTSYGAGFNAIGGGVFAHLWETSGISMWHFERSEIPDDITNGTPNPLTWPTPTAYFPNTLCQDMSELLFDHVITLDTTLCGSYAGNVFSAGGCPGTCEDFVAKASNFQNAKWAVNYIAVYNTTSMN